MPPPGHHRVEDAMHWQQRLLGWWESQQGREFGWGYAESMGWSEETRPMLAITNEEALRQADPVYVSGDVTEIIDRARETWTPERIMPTDPFTMCGFLLFPRSITIRDRWDARCSIRAMQWMPIIADFNNTTGANGMRNATDADLRNPYSKAGLAVSYYSALDDDDDYNPEIRAMREAANGAHDGMPNLTLVHYGFVPFNTAYTEVEGTVIPGDPDYLAQASLPQGITAPRTREEDLERSLRATREYWSLAQVTWRLGQQLVASRERPARADRRQARRRGLVDEITVIRLRRPRHPTHDGDGHEVEWDHRWLVRGHWRNQWYASIKAHRQIWVSAYVKGPEDKPLIFKKRAFEFTR